MLVFVHGWKNDASPENEAEKNLGSFKKVLIQLTMEEMRRSKAEEVQRRQVIGVYMAWSGLTTNNKLLKQLTFFGRKNAGSRASSSASGPTRTMSRASIARSSITPTRRATSPKTARSTATP